VLTGAEATKILFKTGTQNKKTPRVAEAVEFVSGGQKYKVKAKREVIVAAGALVAPTYSPDFLFLTLYFSLQARSRHLSFWSSLGSEIEACSRASALKL
jgi:hypothetical protein